MDIIILIVSIVLFLVLGLSFVIGFFRTFKGNLANLISVVITTVLCFLLYGLIASLLTNIEIAGYTIQGFIEGAIQDALEVKKLNSEVISEYTKAIATTIWKLPTFILLLTISYSAILPLLNLLFRKILPLSSQKTTNIGLKIAGAFMTFIAALVCITITTAPIIGAVDVAKDVYEEVLPSKELRKDEIYQVICDVEAAPIFTFVGLYSGEDFWLQKTILGSMTTIETPYGDINLVKDKSSYIDIVELVMDITDAEDEEMFNTIVDRGDDIINILETSETIPVLMPLLFEVLSLKIDDEKIDFDQFRDITWNEEIKNLSNILKSVFDTLEELELDPDNIEEVLGNSQLPDALSKLGKAINDGGELKKLILSLLNSYLIDALIEEVPQTLKPIFEIMDLTKFDLSKDFETLGEIGNLIYEIGLDETQEIDYFNCINEIGNLIELPFELAVVMENEQLVIECLIEFAGLDKLLEENNIEVSFDEFDITEEIPYVKDAVVNLLRLLKAQGATDLENIDFESVFSEVIQSSDIKVQHYFDNLLDALVNSELLSSYMIDFLSELFNEYGNEWKSDLFISIENGYKDYDKTEFKESLKILIDCTTQFAELSSLDLYNLSDYQISKYESLMQSLNDCVIIELNHVLNLLEDGLFEMGITINLMDEIYDHNQNGSVQDEWSTEITRIFDILGYLKGVQFNTSTLDVNASHVGTALDVMKESYIFGNDLRNDGDVTIDDNIFNTFIELMFTKFKLIKPMNTNGFLTLDQVRNEDWTRYNWNDELWILRYYDITDSDIKTNDLSELQDSKIFTKFFDISEALNNKFEGLSYTISGHYIDLSDYIADGNNLENTDLQGRDWVIEAGAMDDLIYALGCSQDYQKIHNLNTLVHNNPTTFAGAAAQEILDLIAEDE